MNIRRKFTILVTLVLIACLGTGMATAQLSLSPGVKLTQNSSLDVQPSWSSDGRKIVFVSSRDYPSSAYVNREIYVMNANGSNPIRLTNNSVYDGDPDWSPDGTKIVFTSNYEIYVMNANGSNSIRLTETVQSYAPVWSPDGTQIAFTSNTRSGGGGEIYVMNANGSNPRNLTQNGDKYFDAYPTWSPDGTQIAFYSTGRPEGFYGIYVMNADGSNPTRLTGTGQVFDLTYSSDGAKIAFVTGSNIYVMNADGSNRVQLTESNDIDLFGIDWSPDGHELVFVSARDGDKDIYVSNVNQTVNIPDRNLRAAIEKALGKASGTTITPADMATLTRLDAPNANISNLTGLEYAINLSRLHLGEGWAPHWTNSNSISDISALSGLTNLTYLNLQGNSISAISAVSGLTNLQFLYLYENNISDISSVANLTNLTELRLGKNNILDISWVANLTNLTELSFYSNSISDISPVASLINLQFLDLSSNPISDISPVAGLTNLTHLFLQSNRISDISAVAGLTNLTELLLPNNNISDISPVARLTNLAGLTLRNNRISNISVLSGLINLTRLDLSSNSVSDLSPLSGLTNLTRLYLNNNSISNISPLVSNTGLETDDKVNVKGNSLNAVSVNTHIPTLQSRGVRVSFDPPTLVNIPDPNLHAKIESALYWADYRTGKIQRANLDGSNVEDFATPTQGVGSLEDIALDTVNGKIYWTEVGRGKILRVNLDGSNAQVIQRVRAGDLALDVVGGKMYWTDADTGKIQRANLDGSNVEDLVTRTQGLGRSEGIALDVAGSKIYWTDLETGKIQRANLDGSNVQDLVTGLVFPLGIALDVIDGKMYWTDADTGKIQRANLDGSNVQDLVTSAQGLLYPVSIALDVVGGKMYWTDTSTDKVQRANLDGSNVEDLVTEGLLAPTDIAISVPTRSTPVVPLPVDIPDRNLRAKIESTLGKASGATITTADMETLTTFIASYTGISNLTGLEYAVNLTVLHLDGNGISDISALSGLTNLPELDLESNNISDISPLVSNTGLGSGDKVDVTRNPLSAVSINTHIPTLQGRGVEVLFDVAPVRPTTVTVSANPNTLDTLESGLVTISIDRDGPVIDETVTLSLSPSVGTVSAVTNNGDGTYSATYTSGGTAGNVSLTATATGAGVSGSTTITIVDTSVNIPDPNLRAAIERTLGKASGATITAAEMATLTELYAPGSNISNLTGLEYATNLTKLEFEGNSPSNISLLSNLTNLTHLNLSNNSISNLSALAGLTNLTELDLYLNNISDLSPLVSNTGLGSGDKVNVRGNPLNTASINTHIPMLQGRDVEVQFDPPLVSPPPQPYIYWTKRVIAGGIQRANLDGSNVEDLVTGLNQPNRIALDVTGGKMYWTNIGMRVIQRANLDGSNVQTLVTGLTQPSGIALDIAGEKMYWTDHLAGGIQRANLDGSNIQTLVTGLAQPSSIALDIAGGKMYWTDWNRGKIQRANLDGSNIQDLITRTQGVQYPIGIALDVVGGKMYWADSLTGKIQRANLDGSNVQDLVTGLTQPSSIALDVAGRKMYWTDEQTDKIQRANLDGSNVQDFVTGLQSPLGIAIGVRAIIAEPPQSVNILVVEGIVYEADGATPAAGVVVTVTVSSTWSRTTQTSSDGSFEVTAFSLTDAVASTGDTISIVVTDDTGTERGKTEFVLTNKDLGEGSAATITRDVQFDPLTSTTLQKISGDNQKGVPGAVLAEPFVVEVSYDDGTSAVGVSITFTVTAGGGTLNTTSVETDASGKAESTLTLGIDAGINTVSVSVAGTQQTVTFNAVGESPHFDLSVPAGTSLIHVPLKVTAVDGVPQTITSVADLYDALGGAETVNLLAIYDHQTQQWRSYRGPSSRGTAADPALTDDKGIMAGMKKTVTLRLSGDALGTDGTSSITLHPGTNVVGLPLKAPNITRVSDLFTLDGIKDNVTSIIVSDKGKFKIVGRAGDDGDIPIIGGQAFSLPAQHAATVTISGEGWYNTAAMAAAPLVTISGIEAGNITPVLALTGSIVDERTGRNPVDLRVIVKNLSTGRGITGMIGDEGIDYQCTVVDMETGRAAAVGDSLEISVRSPSPFIGVESVRYTVTAEDVKQSWIHLPGLVVYEIPTETELLANYPNPFNPETLIPYRLAEDAFVTLTIYDTAGGVVRSIDVGHKPAAVYESKGKAIHWDGRNEFGEQVGSGVYFYHLSAGDYSTTRKMLIIK